MSQPPIPAAAIAPMPRPMVTVAVLLLAAMTIMANATIASSLPGMKAHFADVAGIDTLTGLILTLPSLTIVFTAGLAGWLADRVDRQKLLVAAALLYAIGGSSGLWAETLPQLLFGRAVLGAGVAGTMTLAMAWGADLWQGPARARMMGIQGAAMSFGGIVVMLLGGALATLHWRGAFSVYLLVLPIAALGLVMLAPHARQLRATRATARAEGRAKTTEAFPWAIFAFVGSLAFVFMAIFYVMPTRMPFLLEQLGVSNTFLIGAIMATLTLASMPGALSYGWLRRFVGPMTIFAASFALMGLGMVVISQAGGVAGVVIGTLIAGAGMGPSMPNYTTYFMGHVPASQRGRASGLLTTAFFAGQFAAPLVAAPLVVAFGLQGTFEALGLAQIVLGAGLGVAVLNRRRPTAAEA
ncbi:MFS transporter [Fertoebacter nigrum]|uniref:MFS transporter n=1 Tax=Fertoeibacter niger TaxID=2656921 RepID=A0A8X8GZ08_9RHOB|nr:MFS transporter [Fertoeibacter niger]NUB43082.1 MFS transporter [Fertoeibacter niger]